MREPRRQRNGSHEPSGLDRRVLVIGAGPAGLATTWRLERVGIPVRLVDRAGNPGSSWRSHYDSLELFSPRLMSSLPGMVMPRSAGRYPARDDVIAYLDAYAARLRTPIDGGVDVKRIERVADRWRVTTSAGALTHRAVVVATGLQRAPKAPAWTGMDSFSGAVAHARDYRNAQPYRGQDVLVVGAGISGTDIALDLARGGAARVRLAVRTPPLFHRLSVFGVSVNTYGQLLKFGPVPERAADAFTRVMHRLLVRDYESALGIPRPRYGYFSAFWGNGGVPNFDRGGLAAMRRGEIEVVAALDRFEDGDVVLADATRMRPDAIVLATGQHPALEPLVGHLGVLNRFGRPIVHAGDTAPHAPGLFFIGFRVPPAQLADIRLDSLAIARRLEGKRARLPLLQPPPRPRSNPTAPDPARVLRAVPAGTVGAPAGDSPHSRGTAPGASAPRARP